MKKVFLGCLLFVSLAINACNFPTSPGAPTAAPVSASAQPTSETPPTRTEPTTTSNRYTNSAFGLSFEIPAGWHGPDEYISDQTLRVAVGSDIVYPYGTGLEEQKYTTKNSYYVTVQYAQNDQNAYWKEIVQDLQTMADGQALDDGRGRTIRVRSLNLGRFQGFEYIATLSESAQTELVYIRQVILHDDQSNLITIMGAPNNVDLTGWPGWREAFRQVDEANLKYFYQILESLTLG